MNHQLNNKQQPIFPFNYPSGHPETTTMNEAINHLPKSSLIKLNLPKLCSKAFRKIMQLSFAFAGFVLKYATLGGLITSRVLSYQILLMKKALSPAALILHQLFEIINPKINQLTDDFFRFMDCFFMMDYDAILLVAVSADNQNAASQLSQLITQASPNHFVNPKSNFSQGLKFKSKTIALSDLHPGADSNFELNLAKFLDSSKNAFQQKRKIWPSLAFETKNIENSNIALQFNTLKLLFKTQLDKLESVFMSLKFPVAERVFNLLDPLVLSACAQDQFAHEK